MIKSFISQIPQNSKIAIFGAGNAGCGLKKYIDENRKDIEIKFFIDSFVEGEKEGVKIVKPFVLDEYKSEIDLLIYATRRDLYYFIPLFDYLDIKCIYITKEIEQYYRVCHYIPLKEKAVEIFTEKEDIDLYNMLWEARLTSVYEKIANYVLSKHNIGPYNLPQNYLKHYLEYINRDAIKTVCDAGFFNGCNSLVFHKKFKNLEKVYAFEPMYEKVKIGIFDKLLKTGNFCEIVPYCLYDEKTELCFAEFTTSMTCSKVVTDNTKLKATEIVSKINAITLDLYKETNICKKIDFIKMDIEGSELKALKGAIKTIKNDRPQLAISIYHSYDDFVNIPIYLNENLQNYIFKLGHYNCNTAETVLYAIPKELYMEN